MATVTGAICLFVNENISLTQSPSLITQADARVGRPMTPGSVAGVARRTTRRAVVGGAIVGGTVGAGAYYGSSYYGGSSECYRDAYGATVCP